MAHSYALLRRWDVVAALLVLLAALLYASHLHALESRSLRLPGTIAGLADRACVGGRCACAVIEFRSPAGEALSFTSAYCRRTQAYYEEGRYWPGSAAQVLYRPDEPEAAELADSWLLYTTPRGLAIVALAWLALAIPQARRRAREAIARA